MNERVHPLAPGSVAPNFALHRCPGQSLVLETLRGRPLILAFYPALWEPVTNAQVELHQRCLPDFERRSARLLAISVDSVWCQQAFCRHHNVGFPLLSDFEPKGHVAREYGVYAKQTGMSSRALFVVDEAGIIRWCRVYATNVIPSVDGLLTALEGLTASRPC
jgi:peroxiredoxin